LGHKVHPLGFRIGVIHDWQAKWYADKHYIEFLQEDLKLRKAIRSKYAEAGISLVQIDRQANKVSVTIHTARPGIVIGRGGQRVDEMRLYLEELIGKRVQLNIQEIQQPELDAYLVARTVAEQIERRVAYRRAMKQAVFRVTQAGAKGVKISCAGRLGGAEIARRQNLHQGQVPLHTLRADIDYGLTEARTTLGRIGVKVWIYKGDILAQPKIEEVEETPTEAEAKPVEAEAKPVEAEAKPAEAEVKPVEAEAKPVEAEAKPVEAEAKPVEAEAKPAKPKTKRTKPAASRSAKTKPSAPVGKVEKEETDATTEASEIPQES
jgi:small subunit ribosomal protein S3